MVGGRQAGKQTLPVQESQAGGRAGLHGALRGPPTAWGRQADCTTGRTCPRHQRGGREGPSPRTSRLEQRAPSPVCSSPHGPLAGLPYRRALLSLLGQLWLDSGWCLYWRAFECLHYQNSLMWLEKITWGQGQSKRRYI